MAVAHRDAEGEPPTFDHFERRFGTNLPPHSSWREMVELDAVPDARGAFGERAVDGSDRCLLGEPHDARRCEHRDVAGVHGERGVVVGDDELGRS